MEEINKSVLDGSNEEASKRLDEIIKELENKETKANRSVKRAVLLFNLPRICSEQEKRLVYGII